MAEFQGDQAAGLRRLFGREQTRIVTFAAGSVGVGKSILVANLAATLARQGKEVLVFDESTRNSVASCYGALARHDLLQVINREKSLADVLLTVAPGVRVLPAAKAVKKLGLLNAQQQDALLQAITGMEHPADVILVDASLDHPLGFSPLGLAAHETVIVISASSASITDAYALIKKVSLGYARRDFRILVNRARTADEADAIYRNIAELTHRRQLARLKYAGSVPLDEQLRHAARLCQPVLGLFPEAPAAKACRAIASELLDWPVPGEVNGEGAGLEQFVQQLLHLSQHIDPIAIYA
ncbi:MAG: putative MinD-related protein [Proteobacteria bacterium]|nr:putative MinD-related protein [Pseudomonadota bacterium]